MSVFNHFDTRRRAFDLRTKLLTTSATNTTYTAKTGTVVTTGVSTDYTIDRVLRVDGTSGSAMTITVPDGRHYGQRLLVILEVYAATSTVTITTDSGDNGTQLTAAGGYSDLMWMGVTLGWVELNNEAT